MGQKGTGRRLSDQERIEIIAKLEGDKPRASAAECARQYGVSSAAITKLMKMKDKVKQRFQEHNAFSQQRKRGGTERHAAFEDELFQWISAQQHHAAEAGDDDAAAVAPPPLTSAKVQEKAQELLKLHDLGAFRASKGWYYRFCRRYGLSRSSLGADDHDDHDDDHALDHSGGDDSDDSAVGRAKLKRKDGTSAVAAVARKKTKTSGGGWAVQSLQDTLAKAALALDHPQARQYLGEPAAGEMLRSIQQSIGVVQCIRLKKAAAESSADSVETAAAITPRSDTPETAAPAPVVASDTTGEGTISSAAPEASSASETQPVAVAATAGTLEDVIV